VAIINSENAFRFQSFTQPVDFSIRIFHDTSSPSSWNSVSSGSNCHSKALIYVSVQYQYQNSIL
jgi:hypothetical protein